MSGRGAGPRVWAIGGASLDAAAGPPAVPSLRSGTPSSTSCCSCMHPAPPHQPTHLYLPDPLMCCLPLPRPLPQVL